MSPGIPDLSDAIASLMARHGRKWHKVVLRIVGNPEDAEDVMQEAVRRVLMRNLAFASIDELRMYLSRAMSNTAIELYHARKRERLRSRPLFEHVLPPLRESNPHASLENREKLDQAEQLLKLLEEGLDRLPAKQYEAVRITLLEPGSVSIREAGTEKGIPYSTLRHRCVQGIRSLRKYINRALRTNHLKLVMA
jgi:RNA polymerase sigma-70 factor (ECF subfamily)